MHVSMYIVHSFAIFIFSVLLLSLYDIEPGTWKFWFASLKGAESSISFVLQHKK